MSSVLEQKCQKCGGPMHFDPKTQMMVCDYCDSVSAFDIDKVEPDSITEEFSFDDFRAGYEKPDAEKLPVYICKSCGAELLAPAEQISLTCPYCRNNVILSDKVSGNLRPNGIIPFKIAADELPGRLKAFYSGKKLLPKSFFSTSSTTGITGVYVPFWLFSGSVEGEASFVTSTVTRRREGDYSITETSYYNVTTAVDASFDNVPVDACQRISDDLMDSLEPFDMSKVKPFDQAYLAGYLSDRFDTPADNIEARAKTRLENTANTMLASQAGSYDKVKRSGGDLRTKLNAKYYLLPVYLFSIKYLGKNYSFAVNGQSGKIVGELPDNKLLKRIYFLKRFVPIALAILAVFVFRYFIGG